MSKKARNPSVDDLGEQIIDLLTESGITLAEALGLLLLVENDLIYISGSGIMSDIDKSNIDAMYWAEKFCEIMRETDFEIDEGLMVSWFANYRFAVADPMTAEIERLNSRLDVIREAADNLDLMIHSDTPEQEEALERAIWGGEVKT